VCQRSDFCLLHAALHSGPRYTLLHSLLTRHRLLKNPDVHPCCVNEMKAIILSALALSLLSAALAQVNITITAYTDAPQTMGPSGCTTLVVGTVAGFTNPVSCALNACCKFQMVTNPGQTAFQSYIKATSCEGQNYQYNSAFTDPACTTGGSSQMGTVGACNGQAGPQWTGIGALKVTCSSIPGPTPPKNSASSATVALMSLVAAAFLFCF
jgi:hypothetical protein